MRDLLLISLVILNVYLYLNIGNQSKADIKSVIMDIPHQVALMIYEIKQEL